MPIALSRRSEPQLLKRGLTAAGFKAAPLGTKSEEFGVLG
jgi:hypothetical protein